MATVKICWSTFTLLKTITSKTSKRKQKNLRDYRKIFSTISFIFKPIFGPSSIRDPFSRNALPQVFLKSHLFFRKINKHVIFCSLSLFLDKYLSKCWERFSHFFMTKTLLRISLWMLRYYRRLLKKTNEFCDTPFVMLPWCGIFVCCIQSKTVKNYK
jgi:hypothetical protein